MADARHITTALTLGAAILATSVLQSEPAEARRGGGHSRMSKSHSFHPTHRQFTPHQLKSTKSLTTRSKASGATSVSTTPAVNPNAVQTTTGTGNLPHTPPINPGGGPPTSPGGGTKTVPLDPVGGPTPVPIPANPNGGQGTAGGANQPGAAPFDRNGAPEGRRYRDAGAYAETGPSADRPCSWLKLRYEQTGRIDWINRYRQCLTWHYSD
jgi:hypothetical protein